MAATAEKTARRATDRVRRSSRSEGGADGGGHGPWGRAPILSCSQMGVTWCGGGLFYRWRLYRHRATGTAHRHRHRLQL